MAKRSSTKKIAILHDISEEHNRAIVTAVRELAHTLGNIEIYQPIPGYLGSRHSLAKWLAQICPDGLVLPCSCPEFTKILQMGKPSIVHRNWSIKRPLPPDIPVMLGDGQAMGRMAAEHLMGLGLVEFAFFGVAGSPHSSERKAGFLEGFRKSGYHAHILEIASADALRPNPSATRRMVSWLKKLPKPVGVLAFRDSHGRLLLDACIAAGLKVPYEVSVVSVNNDLNICETSNPPLSSVLLDVRGAAEEALLLLDRIVRGKEKMAGQRIIFRPLRVVARQSSDFMAIQDELVLSALDFIKSNASRPIGVQDVLNELVVSRTDLNMKFRKHLKCSVGEMIARVRTKLLADMLMETKKTVTEIADATGFSETTHMVRYFHKHMGITPLKFRRKNRAKLGPPA